MHAALEAGTPFVLLDSRGDDAWRQGRIPGAVHLPTREIASRIRELPADLDVVKRRAAEGCPVLGVRYRDDPAVGTRFDTLTAEIGDAFLRVELPGRKHSTLTAHRQQVAVDRVLAFLRERLL